MKYVLCAVSSPATVMPMIQHHLKDCPNCVSHAERIRRSWGPKSDPWIDGELGSLFKEIDRKYFGGRLAAGRWGTVFNTLELATGYIEPGYRRIGIADRLYYAPCELRKALIHQAIHAHLIEKTYSDSMPGDFAHGDLFLAEVHRLHLAGESIHEQSNFVLTSETSRDRLRLAARELWKKCSDAGHRGSFFESYKQADWFAREVAEIHNVDAKALRAFYRNDY
ncbi:MAG: hypothetical protein V4709_11925 [Pseudomonadota bacterium]